MAPWKKHFVICAILILWGICTATTAHAHATLLQTQPPQSSETADPPDKVRLAFNERVETIFNSIEVLDSRGNRMDDGTARVVGEGDTLELGLKGVHQGQYTVRWRVNSLDGHQVQGHFGFGVKAPPPSEEAMARLSGSQQSRSLVVFNLVVKWTSLTTMTIWLGGIGFWVLVLQPSLYLHASPGGDGKGWPNAGIRRVCAILWLSAIIFFVAQCLALIGQGMIFADLPLAKVLSATTIYTVLAMTSYGQWWSIRILAALLLLMLCAWKIRKNTMQRDGNVSPTRSLGPFALGSALSGGTLLLTIPMSGHARAVPSAMALAVAADWAHLTGTAIWIGGLVFLWSVLRASRDGEGVSAQFVASIAKRFSRVAQTCVVILLITGTYAAWIHIPAWRAFISTDYGLSLLVKLLLVGAILLIAATNRWRILPALIGISQTPVTSVGWTNRFRKLVSYEAMLGLAVLVTVAILTSLPPATAVAATGPVSLTNHAAENMTVNLKLDSAKVGTVHSAVRLEDSSGHAVTDAKDVTLFLRMLDMEMDLETVNAKPTPSGSYEADLAFSMAGRWSISVQVTPPRGDSFVTEFQVSSGQ